MKPFPRTHRTPLSDDDLMIFDALFDMWMGIDCLTREAFRDVTGFAYCHSLSDSTLTDVIARHLAAGRLAARRWKDHTPLAAVEDAQWQGVSLCLSADGGALWEQERDPDWEQFCRGRESVEIPPTHTITSVSRATAYRYLAFLNECDIYSWLWQDVRESRAWNYAIVPWKCMREVTILTALGVPKPGFDEGADFTEQVKRLQKYLADCGWWTGVSGLPMLRAARTQTGG